MKNLVVTISLIFYLVSAACAQDKVIEYVQKIGKYGIRDSASKKWLTAPVYDGISYVYKSLAAKEVLFFMGTNNDRDVLISSNGITVLSPVFNKIEVLTKAENLCIVTNITKDGLFSFFEPGKGILTALGNFKNYSFSRWGNYLILYKQNKYYLFDADKKKYSPGYYTNYNGETITSDSVSLFIVKKNKWSIVNFEGTAITPVEYDTIYSVDNLTLFIVKKDKKFGLFDINGKNNIPVEFDKIEFTDNLSKFIVKKNQKFGLFDTNGDAGIPLEYDSVAVCEIANDLFVTKKNNKYGLFNSTEKRLIENKFDNIALNFPDIYSIGYIDSLYPGYTKFNFLPVKHEGKWGIINCGDPERQIIPFEYDSICYVNIQQKFLLVIKDKKMGFIDFKNNIIYPFIYNAIDQIDGNFEKKLKNKIFLVNNGCSSCVPPWEVSDGKYGLSDSVGNLILDVNAAVIKLYNKGPVNYSQYEDSTFFGFLWNIGGEKIESIYRVDTIYQLDYMEQERMFIENKIAYNLKGGKTGIVDRNGQFIFPAEFDDFVFAFIKYNDDTGEEWGIIPGKISTPSKKTSSTYKVDTSINIIAIKNKKYGVYNWGGKEIIPCMFDSISLDYYSLDVSDSVFKAKKFLKRFYKVSYNDNIGYYSYEGSKLIDTVIKETFQNIELAPLDSVVKNPDFYTNWNDLFFAQVVCRNTVNKKLLLYTTAQYGEEWLGYESVVNKEDYNFVEQGEFSLMDKGRVNLLSDEWYDDFIFIDTYFGLHRFSDLKTQLLLYTRNEIDSVYEKESNSKIYGRVMVPGSLQENRNLFDYYFVKKQGKWFITSIYNSVVPYHSVDFDSIWYSDKNLFQGFRKKKFGYYSYTDQNMKIPEIELEFPQNTYNSHIVCRDCDFKFIQYLKTDTLKQWSPETGEELNDTIVNYYVKIPFVKKGEFNILTEGKKLLLKDWADEIRVPVSEPGQNFSITDSSSTVYQSRYYSFNDGWPLYNDYQKSIALKFGTKWRLTTIQNQEVFIDGFDDIKNTGEYWEAKKEGKTFLYTIDGLQLKE